MARREIVDLERLVTPEEMAKALSVRVRWVREKLLKTGSIPTVRVTGTMLRVRRQDWEIFLSNRTKGVSRYDVPLPAWDDPRVAAEAVRGWNAKQKGKS